MFETAFRSAPALSLLGYPYAGFLAASTIVGDSGATVVGADGQPCELVCPGIGYWLFGPESRFTWRTFRPYPNPFPAGETAPRVKALVQNGCGAILLIEASGKLLDVYFQDIGPTNVFEPYGWNVAALDIPAGLQKEVVWRDTIPLAEPPSVCDLRAYIVARADLSTDSDRDGIPDARRRFLSASELAVVQSRKLLGSDEGEPVVPPERPTASVRTESFTSKHGRTVFVDPRGNDSHRGRIATCMANDGPKRTISAGLEEAESGDTLVIHAGHYGEPLNTAGRGIALRIEGHVDLTRKGSKTKE
jgi:hypothetical protein